MQLIQGDCLEILPNIPDKSIDMILTDPPYGTTACKWDTIIPLDKMWIQLKRIIKNNGAIILFGSEPFSSYLRISNIENYKYDWTWRKQYGTGFLNAWKMPLRDTENICVFYSKQVGYNPIIQNKPIENIRPVTDRSSLSECYGKFNLDGKRKLPPDKSMPKTTLEFNTQQNNLHPTEKPVKLMEYLIKTYTLENETVLDFTMGSGTTGVACKQLNRDFIGIELYEDYFKIAEKRISKAVYQRELF